MNDRSTPGTSESLEALLDRWRKVLSQVSDEGAAAEARHALDGALRDASTATTFESARRALDLLLRRTDGVRSTLEGLVERTRVLHEEWAATRRYTEAGLAALREELEQAKSPAGCGRRWLNELIDAIRAREWDAAAEISEFDLPFPDTMRPGRALVLGSIAAWAEGQNEMGLELLQTLEKGSLPAWEDVIDTRLRSRASRVAAWLALRVLGDGEAAARHLDLAIELDPDSGPSRADRAAYFLFSGQLERGLADAQRAVELEPSDPAGYLQLGAYAELSDQFEDARTLYKRGLALMPTHVVAIQSGRASILDPSGILLGLAAEILLDAGLPREALEAAEAALNMGVRGNRAYPEADVHRLRSLAIEQIPDFTSADAALAATDAGRLYVSNGELDAGAEQLERALELDRNVPEAGWALADALIVLSYPTGAEAPDHTLVARALAYWNEASELQGCPQYNTSWAYLTRAIIAEYDSYQPDGSTREDGALEAALHAERAIVLNDMDGLSWGFAARYLRMVGLTALEYEAVERGFELASTEAVVLYERLEMLRQLARYDEAEAVGADLAARFGEETWVNETRAWLAFHEGRWADALSLLAGLDQAWDRNLRALNHLAQGEISAGEKEYELLLADERTMNWRDTSLRAVAAVAGGDLDRADSLLAKVAEDSNADPYFEALAGAFLAAARDDVDAMMGRLATAIEASVYPQSVDEALQATLLRLRLLPGGEAALASREQGVREVSKELHERRIAELAEQVPTAESELAEWLDVRDDESNGQDLEIATALLLAIEGRRRLQAQDFRGAAMTYQRLRGSVFEPEATTALERSLMSESADRAAAGDVAGVQAAQEQLLEIGEIDPIDAALSVALALEQSGDIAEARRTLTALPTAQVSDARRIDIDERLADLALVSMDFGAARKQLDAAATLAQAHDDNIRLAELRTRLSLVAAVSDDPAAERETLAALDAWRDAQVWDPAWAYTEEVRELLAKGPLEWADLAGAVLTRMLDTLRDSGSIDAYTKDALSSYASELQATNEPFRE